MRKAAPLLTFSMILLILLQVPSYGWNNRGHMAVAFVAYRKLNPVPKSRVKTLLMLNPEFNQWRTMISQTASDDNKWAMLFMIAATWPDRIKGNGDYHNDGPQGGNRPPNDPSARRNTGYDDFARHKYWHFVDKPFSQDGTTLHGPPEPNAEDRINLFRQVLASNSPDPLKSYDLVWLLHIVGDIHQPLHCTARFGATQRQGDDGGNLVNLCGFDPQCTMRLHAFWDGLLGPDGGNILGNAASVANSLPQPPANLAANPSTAVWINESFLAAQSNVYVHPIGLGRGPFPITATYRNAATALARQRAALAGARLANILNNELR